MGARRDEREQIEERLKDRYLEPLQAAYYALRSYHLGNASPDLAREVADRLETTLGHSGRLPLVRGEYIRVSSPKQDSTETGGESSNATNAGTNAAGA